jgi:hypothetical protein
MTQKPRPAGHEARRVFVKGDFGIQMLRAVQLDNQLQRAADEVNDA